MNLEDPSTRSNITRDFQALITKYRNETFANNLGAELNPLPLRETVIITCYSSIVIVSIFGNLLVCNIVACKASMRRTTYVLIANLAFSDLLMTVLNIPFNVARVLLNDWPFGGFMCSVVPLVQATSVYVSTFTMMVIALDRYRVICKPLLPRLAYKKALKVTVLVWIVSIFLSLPHAIFNKIETIFTIRPLIRCRSIYPEHFGPWITLVTFMTQYFLPLSITGLIYVFIICQVYSRDVLGVVTEAQLQKQAKAKRKTIKMLVLVVIIFATCWLPLNVYHLLREFTTLKFGKSSTFYFICHWLAMSSVCYNPFIYCWLNKNFRIGAIACLICIRNVGPKLQSSFRYTRETKQSLNCNLDNFSFESRTGSSTPMRESTRRQNEELQPSSPNKSFCHDSTSEKTVDSVQMTYLMKRSNSWTQTVVAHKIENCGAITNNWISTDLKQNRSDAL